MLLEPGGSDGVIPGVLTRLGDPVVEENQARTATRCSLCGPALETPVDIAPESSKAILHCGNRPTKHYGKYM